MLLLLDGGRVPANSWYLLCHRPVMQLAAQDGCVTRTFYFRPEGSDTAEWLAALNRER